MRTLVGLALVWLTCAVVALVLTGQIDRVPNCPTVTYHGKCL